MPTTYAHYRFGKDVLQRLPEPFRAAVGENRELFDIGVHGPDVLFYYHPLFTGPVNAQGSQKHREYADGFFRRAADIIAASEDPSAARAYIYGFICHFALDSEMHGYVEKMIQVTGCTHTAIERELDRFLMAGDGLDPVTYAPIGHIAATRKNAEVIAPFFDGIDAETMEKTLISMRRVLKALLPLGPVKRPVVAAAFKLLGCYESKMGLFMCKNADPKCARYMERLRRVYEDAVPVAANLLLQYQRVLFQKEELCERFHRTFGAGEHWEELEL